MSGAMCIGPWISLEFPPEVRRIIYTTNAIESLNYQLCKIIKNRGHFPNDDAVIKLLWLAIRDIEDKRARQRADEAGKPRTDRKAPGRLVEEGHRPRLESRPRSTRHRPPRPIQRTNLTNQPELPTQKT